MKFMLQSQHSISIDCFTKSLSGGKFFGQKMLLFHIHVPQKSHLCKLYDMHKHLNLAS